MTFVDPIAGKVGRPDRLASDFQVRALVGSANDYSSLVSAVSDAPPPAKRITVIVRAPDDGSATSALAALDMQTYDRSLVDVIGVRPEERQAAIASAQNDWIVLLDSDVDLDAELIERFALHLAVSEKAIYLGLDPGDLTDEPEPFRFADDACMAFAKSLFDDVGAFNTALGAGDAAIEWAYRAWNRGAYIVPIVNGVRIDRRVSSSVGIKMFDVPQVSIYIPAYNAVDTIGPAIRSALAQTVTDLEVCVVDDGSTDGTTELLTNAFGADPRVRIERHPNSGIGQASNRAVQMCRAPFIGQLDADDLLKPDAVARCLEVINSDPRIGVVYTSSELIDSEGKHAGDGFEFPYFSRYELMYLMIVHHFRLFRARDWYRTAGFATDMTNAVDYDMYLKLSEVTQIVHLPEQLYQYRKHDASTSQARHSVQRANHRLAVQRSLDRQGLSAEWEMVPKETVDPRDYEFERREQAPRAGNPGTEHVRISIGAGKDATPAIGLIAHLFASWEVTVEFRDGENRVDSPWLPHGEAMEALETFLEYLPRHAIRLVYP